MNKVISIFWREQDAPAVFCCQMRVSWENDLIKNEITGPVVIFADKAEGFTQAAL